MTLNERIDCMAALGAHWRENTDEYLQAVMQRTAYHNPWLTLENQQEAVSSIARNWLQTETLQQWASGIQSPIAPKRVGLVLAGNIPMVGFHDLLAVFLAGHISIIKLSDKDPYLVPAILKWLHAYDARTANYFVLVDRLKDMDAVIATGSNNTARYFESYFSKYPHIIRKNRNAVAVLTGQETKEELHALGKDMLQYFGLGCRNVAKVFVPAGYDFSPLLEAVYEYRNIVLHSKYKNNFDYQYALAILNKAQFMANGCMLFFEEEAYLSPVGCLYYTYYSGLPQVEAELLLRADAIQCVVTSPGVLSHVSTIPFGKAQHPDLTDYADGVDTLAFLQRL